MSLKLDKEQSRKLAIATINQPSVVVKVDFATDVVDEITFISSIPLTVEFIKLNIKYKDKMYIHSSELKVTGDENFVALVKTGIKPEILDILYPKIAAERIAQQERDSMTAKYGRRH